MEIPGNILLLDADEHSARDVQRFLKVSAYAFAISHVSTLNDAVIYLKTRKPSLVLLDAGFTSGNDFSSFSSLLQSQKVPFILLSQDTADTTHALAQKTGATDYLIKNKINLFHLQKTIVNTLKLNEAEVKLDDKAYNIQEQNNSFYELLNHLEKGVIIINSSNVIRYANTQAQNVLGERNVRQHLTGLLKFASRNGEVQTIEIALGKNQHSRITSLDFKWDGEVCNLFFIEAIQVFESTEQGISSSELNILLDSIQEPLLLVQSERVRLLNNAAQILLGRKASEIIQWPIAQLLQTENKPSYPVTIEHFLTEKDVPAQLMLPDGATIQAHIRVSPVTCQGNLCELYSIRVDSNEEAAPHSSTRSTDDTITSQDVLHLASHDLREPIRTILNYVQLLTDKLDEHKYAEAKEYASYARDSAARMERLLTDLKTYISLNTHQFQLGKTSMKMVLAHALKQLKPRIDETGAEISFTELPDVTADRELVEKLMFLLIDNALKFHKKDRKPVIDIGYDKFEGNIIFCVRDNGIGISRKYYQRIFELFERLNRVDEYPGNGLGLALCKKIVELHGGEIWVESLPGSGSNFYFTLRSK